MADDDRIRWNERYVTKQTSPSVDSLLLKHADRFKTNQRALDVACGLGHNTLWLAEKGLRVSAIDISDVGLSRLTKKAQDEDHAIETICADLDDWTWPPGTFDHILVFRYLDRNLFPRIRDSLVVGGTVYYYTFGPEKLAGSPQFNPAYVLARGELLDAFAGFRVIDHDEAAGNFSYIVAEKLT